MVYGFARQSQGHLRLRSEPGTGTTVSLYFPRTPTPATNFEATVLPITVKRGGEHVLVVEDDDLVRSHVVRQLVSLGYTVSEAQNGHAALEIIHDRGDIDLLFTDLVMPGGMSGRDLAGAATQLRPGLRILFTSGYSEDSIILYSRPDQSFELLQKPYRRQDLARRLWKVLDD